MLKYLAFWVIFAAGVPAVAMLTIASGKVRGLLLTALVFTTVLGDVAGINFISMEHYRGPDRGFEVTLTDLLALGMSLGLIVKFSNRIEWLPFNSLWLAAFFGIACVSLATSSATIYSAFTLFKMLRVYVLYWCVANTLRVGVDPRALWRGYVLLGAAITLIAIKQKYLDGIYRIPGPFDHSNTLPLYVNLVIPVLLAWSFVDARLKTSQVAMAVVVAGGMLFAVAATFSRAGIALSMAAVCAAVAISRARVRSPRTTIAGAVVLLLMTAGVGKAADSMLERIRTAPESSAEARDEFNRVAERMADEHLFGVGINNFSLALTTNAVYRDELGVMANEEHGGVAHHIYWLTAAELGYPGLAVFLVILLRFLWLAMRNGFGDHSIEATILVACGVGLCTLHSSGFLEWAFRITPVSYMFAITCALCVALGGAIRDGAAPRRAQIPAAALPAPVS